MNDSRHSPRRRAQLAGLGFLGLFFLIAVLGVVPPRGEHAVIEVSRFGSVVRLFPDRFSFSFLPLAKRIRVPCHDGAAVLQARLSVPCPGGPPIDTVLRISIWGAGALPLDASAVRERGLETAAGQWLQETVLPVIPARSLVGGSELWRKIFPDDAEPSIADLQPVIDQMLPGLEVGRVEVIPQPSPAAVRAAARAELAARVPNGGRLIVLGLDALDWVLVDELMARGLMPTMQRLVADGAHAVLDVPPPLISPVVWTTIATGVSPEVHGILDFLESSEDGQPRPVSSASRKATAIWEMTAAADRTSAVIGWWATFPAQAPAGCTVYSDRLTEQLLGLEADAPGIAAPPEAASAVRGLVLRGTDMTSELLAPFARVTEPELEAWRQDRESFGDLIGGLATLIAATTTVDRLTEHELGRGTEVILSYLEGTDTVGHLFAPHRPPPQAGVSAVEARRFGQVVDRYHAWVDRWLARVVAEMDDTDTLVIVSDHGFTWRDRPPVAAGVHTPTAVWWHRPEGVFLAVGPSVLHTSRRQRLGVLDVAPVLLSLAGLPPAAEMTGSVPAWLLSSDTDGVAASKRRVSYGSLLPRKAPQKIELPQEARDEELAKLRALGYVASDDPEPEPDRPPKPLPTRPVVDRAEARRLANLGTTQVAAGERKRAEETFRQAIATDPSYPVPYYNLSLMYQKDGRFDAADREFWKAVELGVADREMAVVRLALIYGQQGDSERALQVFNEGLKRLPGSEMIWLNAGVFLGELGRFAESQRCLERAVTLSPDSPRAHANLAVALLELGDREGARRALAEAVRLDPDNQQLRSELSRLGGGEE